MVRLRRRNPFTDITQRLLPRHGNGVTWEEARAHGLNSDTFVVEQREGDERIGLDGDQADFVDTSALKQIASIMRTRGVGFDEARYQLVRQQMIANGVDPDTGLPIDANLVTFDG
ncbi:hypothetical protein BC830DRAFT_1081022 [Chytriomyces sp. MP71]|nr:hypothetical protein BC830DRAFT_1081022 [Chytriomyces sp. MP71]